MTSYLERYQHVQKITHAIDCIIFGFDKGALEILLIERGFEPEEGKWSLAGGFVNKDEDVDAAAKRVLRTLTGLENVYLEQVKTFGRVDRDPVVRVISTAYITMILKSAYEKKKLTDFGAKWFPLDDLPNLIFDHAEMVQTAMQALRIQIPNTPIALNLLPKKFTLPQLQRVYECILNQPIDKRNFRKKIFQMNFFVKLDEKDKTGSRKGAYLYFFDESLFNEDSNFSL
ncbi:MAG: NUDIX domain-containing protein [Bacteroidota bacterium]